MSWLEHKYIGILSTRLRNFKRKSADLYNFSCPICGDSQKDSRKARAYIYLAQSRQLRFHCHNGCGTLTIPNLLKTVDEFIYREFLTEKVLEDSKSRPEPVVDFTNSYKPPKFVSDSALKELKKISSLSNSHFAKAYVLERMIPSKYHSKLFFAPKFMTWVNTFVTGKFEQKALKHDGPALVIPFINKDKRMHALQARYFSGDVRYITIVLDESVPKIYGLDNYDKGNKSYVLEGPIDSMFLDNAVATAGGTELSTLKYLNLDNSVIVFDNEPRSRDTIKKISKSIKNGLKVCIWPDGLHFKDVNDMIRDGLMSQREVKEIIDTNTFSGLSAELRLRQWDKT